MTKIPTNKLSIYLIKQEYSSLEDIFKDHEKLESENINNVGDFYFGDSHVSPPSWIKKFFGSFFDNNTDSDNLKIFTASSKAVFLATVENRIFALAFGYGHTLLKPGVWEERFGLKVALNVIDAENLRSIDKKNMSIIPKLSKEQMTKDGTFADFRVDVEQDLIQGITGKTKNEDFGQTITGKDALSLSVKIDVSSIKDFLKDCYTRYNSDEYKKEFAWIDQVAEIKDLKTVENLDNQLLEKIQNESFDKTWMAIPEILTWEDVSEFKFKQESFGDDIDLPTYLGFLSDEEKQELSIEILKRHFVDCISASSDENMHSWKVYNCLYCEIKNESQMHILSNGKWYQIENNFAKEVFDSFDSFKKQPVGVSLPECNQNEHEDKYNERVAGEVENICSMDRQLVPHGGVGPGIEFCDLLTKDRKLIHVKHYGASSVLSHLFSQGLVSGELLLSDEEFREKLNTKLDELGKSDHKLSNTSEKPRTSDYEIVFAIISKSDSDLDIPFFSKVNIRNAKKRLDMLNYKVSLLKIATAKTS